MDVSRFKMVFLLGLTLLSGLTLLLTGSSVEVLFRAVTEGFQGFINDEDRGRRMLVLLGSLVFVVLYVIYMRVLLKHKNNACLDLLEQLKTKDPFWDPKFIHAEVEMTYYQVEQAWIDRTFSGCRERITDRLYEEYRWYMEEKQDPAEKTGIKGARILNIQVVAVDDRKDDRLDSLWVCIQVSAESLSALLDFQESRRRTSGGAHGQNERAELMEYLKKERVSFEHINGSDEIEEYAELWKFVRGPKGWLLDEIDEMVSFPDLIFKKASTEV